MNCPLTSESGVFGDWISFLINHPLCVAMVGRNQHHIATLLTSTLYLTYGFVCEGGREEGRKGREGGRKGGREGEREGGGGRGKEGCHRKAILESHG